MLHSTRNLCPRFKLIPVPPECSIEHLRFLIRHAFKLPSEMHVKIYLDNGEQKLLEVGNVGRLAQTTKLAIEFDAQMSASLHFLQFVTRL
jgi:hypothetical protein